jgi:3-oxoacyl-[acyl-carrier-protein] synthase-3
MHSALLETGKYEPEEVRTNAHLVQMLENSEAGTSEEWIKTCTGILERRIAKEWETQEYMAAKAIDEILEKRPEIPREQISITFAGNTHMPFLEQPLPILIPCSASQVHTRLEAGKIPAFDVITNDISAVVESSNALLGSTLLVDGTLKEEDMPRLREIKKDSIVYWHQQQGMAQKIAAKKGMNVKDSYDITTGCASHGFGMALADAAIRKSAQYIIVVGVDKMLQVTNPKDRRSVVLFGELAGAILLGPSETLGFIYHRIETDSSLRDAIRLNTEGWFEQNGRAVYTVAVKTAVDLIREGAMHCTAPPVVAPHQANPSMIKSIMAQKSFPKVKDVIITGDMFGNSSTASPPHALDYAIRTGRLKKGDYFLEVSFGAGFSYALNVGRYI